jgi:hypothetical protein
MALPANLELSKKVVRDDTFEFPLPTPGTRLFVGMALI